MIDIGGCCSTKEHATRGIISDVGAKRITEKIDRIMHLKD